MCFFDLSTIVTIFFYAQYLKFALNDYSRQYEEQSIRVKDYTVQLDKLPSSYRKYKSKVELMMALWRQIYQSIYDCK